MHLSVTIKQAGRYNEARTIKLIDVSTDISTLQELLTEIVIKSVQEYNQKSVDSDVVALLTNNMIAKQAQTGKIGFLRRINSKNADTDEAVSNALQCFSDGLYRVFVDKVEITTLSEQIAISEGSLVVFVRMTMLSGRLW